MFAFVEWIREDVEWDHLWYHLQHPSLCQDREGNRGILYGPGALVNHSPAFPWWGGVNSDYEMSFQVLVRGRYVTCIEHVNGIDTSNIVEAETYVDDVDPDVNQLSQDVHSTETTYTSEFIGQIRKEVCCIESYYVVHLCAARGPMPLHDFVNIVGDHEIFVNYGIDY